MHLEREASSIDATIDSTSDQAPDTTVDTTVDPASLPPVDQAFLEELQEPAIPGKSSRFSRAALNFLLFCVVIVAIVTVCGIGLTWFGVGAQRGAGGQLNQPAPKPVGQMENGADNPPAGKSRGAESSNVLAPAPVQPAGPAGHADIRSQTAEGKKAGGK